MKKTVVYVFACLLCVVCIAQAGTTPTQDVQGGISLSGEVSAAAVTVTASNSISIHWTAPADSINRVDSSGNTVVEFNGAATMYEIAYSLTPIDSQTAGNAPSILDSSFIPSNPGETEEYLVVGLNPGTTYYFAVRAADATYYNPNVAPYEPVNWSKWSNVVAKQTSPAVLQCGLASTYDYDVQADGSIKMGIHEFTASGGTFLFEPYWCTRYGYDAKKVVHVLSGRFDEDSLSDIAHIYDYGIQSDGRYKMGIHVFCSNGSSFVFEPYWCTRTGFNARQVKFAVATDLNSDSKDDIIMYYVYDTASIGLHAFLSTGSSFTFRPYWFQSSGFSVEASRFMLGGDFNDDGFGDVAIAYRYTSRDAAIHLFRSIGSTFTYLPNVWSSGGYSLDSTKFMTAGDVNDDGKVDIISAYLYNDTTSSLHVFPGTNGGFNFQAHWWQSNDFQLRRVRDFVAGDFDGSGVCDVLMSYENNETDCSFNLFSSTNTQFVEHINYWQRDRFAINRSRLVSGYFVGLASQSQKVAGTDEPTDAEVSDGQQFADIGQNYPNPFNPITTISYTIPEASHVSLEILNILGQRVETLVNEQQAAGGHSVQWNANQYATGVYFYRFTVGTQTKTKKMLLIK